MTDRELREIAEANAVDFMGYYDRTVIADRLETVLRAALRSRSETLEEAAQFVVDNLPGSLFNSLGRTSYDYGEQAKICAERELVNLRAALAAQQTRPESARGTADPECWFCGGSGYDPQLEPEIVPICCRHAAADGSCCGNPEPSPSPQQCRVCHVTNRLREALADLEIAESRKSGVIRDLRERAERAEAALAGSATQPNVAAVPLILDRVPDLSFLRLMVNPAVPEDEVWINDKHGKRLATIINVEAPNEDMSGPRQDFERSIYKANEGKEQE